MEIENKETPKSWKIKAKEKSIMIKALEKEKKRLQKQSQSYRSTNKMLRLALAEKVEKVEKTGELKAILIKRSETGVQEDGSKKKIKEISV